MSLLSQHETRSDYDNAAEFNELYPEWSKLILWPLPYAKISSASKVPTSIKDTIVSRSDLLNKEAA